MARSRIVIVLPHEIVDPESGETVVVPGSQSVVLFSAQEEAQADIDKTADDAAQVPIVAAQTRKDAFKADANYQALLAQLKQATPAQVQTYITNNVTDLASARAMLVKFALVLALVANGG